VGLGNELQGPGASGEIARRQPVTDRQAECLHNRGRRLFRNAIQIRWKCALMKLSRLLKNVASGSICGQRTLQIFRQIPLCRDKNWQRHLPLGSNTAREKFFAEEPNYCASRSLAEVGRTVTG
jgi:hypothetical protein